MNSEVVLVRGSKIAAAAIPSYTFVRNDATDPTRVNVASAAANVVGVSNSVFQIAGRMADYSQSGRVPVRVGGAIAVGDRIDCNASGQAVSLSTGILGRAETAATAAGQIIYIALHYPNL
jgi:hypothetical protein